MTVQELLNSFLFIQKTKPKAREAFAHKLTIRPNVDGVDQLQNFVEAVILPCA